MKPIYNDCQTNFWFLLYAHSTSDIWSTRMSNSDKWYEHSLVCAIDFGTTLPYRSAPSKSIWTSHWLSSDSLRHGDVWMIESIWGLQIYDNDMTSDSTNWYSVTSDYINKCVKVLMLVLSIGNNDTTMKKLYFCTNRYLIQWLLTEFDKVLGELQFWVKPFTHTVQNVTSSWKENSDSKFAKPYRIKGALDKPSAKWSTSIVHFFSVRVLSSSVVFIHWLLL